MVHMPHGSPTDTSFKVGGGDVDLMTFEQKQQTLKESVRTREISMMLAGEEYLALTLTEQQQLCYSLKGNADEQWQALRKLQPKLRRVAMLAMVHGMTSVGVFCLANSMIRDEIREKAKAKQEGGK